MYGKTLIIGGCAVAILCLSACSSLPHNDVLIFGTETTLAFDVGASATNGGTPQVTLGYNREEAVWMPLMANGRHTKTDPDANQLYQAEGSKASGSNGAKDAYSVFASFGAQLEGTSGTGPSAKVGLAQFFATGIAAQKLAGNPAAVLALTVKPGEQSKADAQAVAAVAGGGGSVGTAFAVKEKAKAEKIYACIKQKGTSAFSVPPSGLPSAERAEYPAVISAITNATDVLDVFDEYGSETHMTSQAVGLSCTV